MHSCVISGQTLSPLAAMPCMMARSRRRYWLTQPGQGQGHGFLVTSHLTMDGDGRTFKESTSPSWTGARSRVIKAPFGSCSVALPPMDLPCNAVTQKDALAPWPLFVAVWLWQAGHTCTPHASP
jgi:hypothetical protein